MEKETKIVEYNTVRQMWQENSKNVTLLKKANMFRNSCFRGKFTVMFEISWIINTDHII